MAPTLLTHPGMHTRARLRKPAFKQVYTLFRVHAIASQNLVARNFFFGDLREDVTKAKTTRETHSQINGTHTHQTCSRKVNDLMIQK